ncbi:Chloroperoxidase, partial [Sparassis latifolia]
VPVSVPEHAHAHHCPITGHGTHAYCPPQKGDSRSPCPALNALANHGYLPRDGKCVTPAALTHALRAGYRLSAPLAWVLTRGGFFLLGQRRAHICLADLARHNCIEHDASLVHPDVAHRDEYAPLHPAPHMLDAFLAHAADGALMTPADVARARVAREASYARPMDALHAEIARGEMAIAALRTRTKDAEPAPLPQPLPGVPVEMLRTWMHEERLPDGWAPYHQLSLTRVVQTSRAIRAAMRALQ